MLQKIATLLGNALNTIFGKVLASLGISFVTITSYQEGLDWVKRGVSDTLASIPSDMLNLIAMSGVTDGLGYFIGAAAFIVSQATINRLVAGVFS